jgi:hypothetical protein
MTKIKKYVDGIHEELEDAKEYAEKSLWYKAKGDITKAAKYKEMSTQELNHANYLHDFAMADIEALKTVYPDPPQDMMKKWEDSHKEYIEKAAWVKQMLAM